VALSKSQAFELELLGTTDALFQPVRDCVESRWAATYIARRRFFARGVRYRSLEATSAARQQKSRTLRELEKSGRVLTARPDGRAVLVRLSDQADWDTRQLLALPSHAATVSTMQKLAKNLDREPRTMDRMFAPETCLSRGKGWGDGQQGELRLNEIMLAPAFCRGWVVSRATANRHVYYAVTGSGWGILDNPNPPDVPEMPANSQADRLYAASFRSMMGYLDTLPANRELGCLPLPASGMKGTPPRPNEFTWELGGGATADEGGDE
jgi:hypothetical protein